MTAQKGKRQPVKRVPKPKLASVRQMGTPPEQAVDEPQEQLTAEENNPLAEVEEDLVQEPAVELAVPGAPAPRPPKAGLTPRQAFGALAIVLALVLIALLVYLSYLLRPHALVQRGGQPVEGIQPLFVIQGPGTGPQPTFQRPLGVAYGPNGNIYVTDTGNNRVCVFDRNGGFLRSWGGFGVAKPAPGGVYSWKPGRLNFPDGIAVGDDGSVYVADFYNDCIEVFDSTGSWIRRFPDPMKPVGKGSSGHDGRGIAVTDVAVVGGKVYATDTYQVFVFDTSGKLLEQFGKPGSGPGDLDHPNGVTASADGDIYVSDSNHARVTAFTPAGTAKWNVGRIPAGINDTSTAPLQLPRGLAQLPNGDLVVVDTLAFDLVTISPQGKVLSSYGQRGVAPGEFNFPNDVSVLGSTLAVSDKENNRVQVLKLVAQ